MDRFFQNIQQCLKSDELHLTGVASLILAWKFETVKTYSLEDLSQIIVHGKFTPDEIASRERDILQAIKWKLHETTVYDFIERYIYKLFSVVKESHIDEKTSILTASLLMARACMHNHRF